MDVIIPAARATTPEAHPTPASVPGRSPLSSAPMPHFHIAAFDGPLDLLLHLIRANEVDIYDIPIAEITGQYLAAIEVMEALDLGVAGEFVVMAATLIEIKSRLLLPQALPTGGDEESEDPRAELVARLVEYQQFQGTLETFRVWEDLRRQIYFRGALENVDDYILPVPEGEATAAQLYQALHRMLVEAGVDDKPITAVTPRRRLSLRLKMAELARRLDACGAGGMRFDDLFELPCPRYDIVLTFLALLELLRLGRVRVNQVAMYAAIWLYAVAAEEALR